MQPWEDKKKTCGTLTLLSERNGSLFYNKAPKSLTGDGGDRVVQEDMSHFKSSGLRGKEPRYLRGGKTSEICFPFSPSTRHVQHSMWESPSVVFLRGPLRLPGLQSLSRAATFLFISSGEPRKILFCAPLGSIAADVSFTKWWGVEWRGQERKNAVWAEAGAKVRVSMRGARSCTRVCRRAGGGWREQRIAREGGGEILSGKRERERRMEMERERERDGLRVVAKWEEQYGGW